MLGSGGDAWVNPRSVDWLVGVFAGDPGERGAAVRLLGDAFPALGGRRRFGRLSDRELAAAVLRFTWTGGVAPLPEVRA